MTTEYSGSGDVSRSMELLWDLREPSTRGPKPGLTLGKIVRAAIKIADADGLEALSMRRVAAGLNVGTMSLYRYVPGKSELLDLMLDDVVDVPARLTNAAALPAREVLELVARSEWQACMDHPWYPFVDQARPILGPKALHSVEVVFGHLRSTGLGDQEMVMIVSTVDSFVLAVARAHISARQAEQRTGVSNDEFWSAQEPALAEAMRSGRFPTMAQLSEDTFSFSHDQVFDFGIRRLLDGLAHFIDTKPSAPATTENSSPARTTGACDDDANPAVSDDAEG